MASYEVRELFGGAITVKLPQDYIDSSDLRQIPDHQEVFLSPKTLTSVIFEVNEYVSTGEDKSAIHFHFTDVVAEPDRLSKEPGIPTPVNMANASINGFPAYALDGIIVSPEIDKKAPSALPVDWQQAPKTKDFYTRAYQLVVRMAKYKTDFCVRVNVPFREMKTCEEVTAEEGHAKSIMEEIVATLDVKDFGLFVAE